MTIRTLRVIFIAVLVTLGAIFTLASLARVDRLSARFGPQVRADLEWRAVRGAQELADRIDLGLALQDAAGIEASLGPYADSPDVRAVIAVDTTGAVVHQHGAFGDPAAVFAGPPETLIVGPDYFASWTTTYSKGYVVGKVGVVVSTARYTDALATLRSMSSITVLAGIVRILVGGLVVVVLTSAVASRDRRLEAYAGNLEKMVEDRTRALDQQTSGMRLLLDNVAQGFVTVDLHGAIDGQRSAVIDRWLGAPPPGARFGDLIAAYSSEFAIWFDLGLESLRDETMPIDVVMAQLPARFSIADQLFEVSYSPILDGARVSRVLLIISDVTARAIHERAERAERELVAVFQRITHDRTGFEEFLDDTSALVASLARPADPITEQRTLHTLKGNCRLEGLEGFADVCHAIESEVAEVRTRRPLNLDQRERLRAGWDDVMVRLTRLLGDRSRPVVEIATSELHAAVERLRQGVPGREVAAVLASWAHEPVARRFERLGLHAQQLGRRLGKGEIDVVIRDGGIRLDGERWAPFWRELVHAVSNAVDHGIESEAERIAVGKPWAGILTMAATLAPSGLRVTVADDGRGVDWDLVRDRAARSGLPCATREELEAALFQDGVTTREQATATSGRGVGLAALRAVVSALDGTMTIETGPRAGTTLTFEFPAGGQLVPLRPPSQPIRRVG